MLNNPNGDLQLAITPDASTPNVTASFYGHNPSSSNSFDPYGLLSPVIGFNAVPEPGSALPLLMGITGAGLLTIRRRKR